MNNTFAEAGGETSREDSKQENSGDGGGGGASSPRRHHENSNGQANSSSSSSGGSLAESGGGPNLSSTATSQPEMTLSQQVQAEESTVAMPIRVTCRVDRTHELEEIKNQVVATAGDTAPLDLLHTTKKKQL